MRLAIAHHNARTLDALKQIVTAIAGYDVIWTAADGAGAVRQCQREKPELLLLDLALPVLDGSGTTKGIMKSCPCAILLLTDSVEANAAKVFESMGHGALDAVRVFVDTPTGKLHGEKDIIKKLATIGKLIGKVETQVKASLKPIAANPGLPPPLVAIGASTGGPKALSVILAALPKVLGAAVIIIQHVDEQFSRGLAEWLNRQSGLKVVLAGEGDHPLIDTVLVASTNDHLILGADLSLSYTKEPRDYPYRPSVDVFFESLARHWPRRDMAVLLTGMGRDGAAGLTALRKAGWQTIAQDEKTSVVYGMPAAAIELGGATDILPLDRISPAIMKRLGKK
ncbi:MAG: chemotaxis-specific protein-glutamate methyltransferase CheB [Syntrophales bacterium]